ncbi:MAG TPA: hypothetical protein VGJ22_01955 [Anaerolineales bacterium]|jgi:hypothetical protein
MDELLKALAEAVRTGSAMAAPAIYGYYAVRIIEALCIPLGLGIVAALITRCVVRTNQIIYASNIERARLGLKPEKPCPSGPYE